MNEKLHDALIEISGFNAVRLDRAVSKRGGGLVLYINNAIEFDVPRKDLNISTPDLEILTVTINLPKQTNFLVTLVDLTPTGNKKNALNLIIEISNSFNVRKMARVIGGDFNMDYLGNKNRSLDKTLLLDLETSHNMKQVIKTPTRCTPKPSSTIDLIFQSAR